MQVPGPPPLTLKTPPFAHYGLAWSPFHTNRIALASAANYGLVGNGRLHLTSIVGGQIVLDKLSVGVSTRDVYSLMLLNSYDTQDGLYDIAWSEVNENHLVTGSGDGSIKLWDVHINVCSRSHTEIP